MLVAIDLAHSPKLCSEDDDDEGEEDNGIWPAPKKPRLLPSPWKNLPLDLLFHSVLVRLPFSSLLKLRSVSRSWRKTLSSYDFWFLCFQGPIPNNFPLPYLLLCSAPSKASPGCQAVHWLRQKSIRYVQQQNAVPTHQIPQNAVPTHRIPHHWSRLHQSFMQVQEPYVIQASDGGLLLLARCHEGSQQLIVCNPLLRAHKLLPNSLFPLHNDISATATCFIVDKECGNYGVLLTGLVCQVYNSTSGKWQMISTALFKDPVSASTPMLDGSYFWLSRQQTSMNSNYESTLFVYHARVEVVTCVRTRFPRGVFFPNCGRVWKDTHGLQTLAWSSTWFGTWKLDNGLWKCEKVLPFSQKEFNLAEFDYVKVDNLLLLRFLKFNRVYVFDFRLDKGCWTPCCADSEYLSGHCVFQPSCIQV